MRHQDDTDYKWSVLIVAFNLVFYPFCMFYYLGLVRSKGNILYGPIFIMTIFTFVIRIFLWTALDLHNPVLGRQMGRHNYKVLSGIHRSTMPLCVHNTRITLLRGQIDGRNYDDQYTIIGTNEPPYFIDV